MVLNIRPLCHETAVSVSPQPSQVSAWSTNKLYPTCGIVEHISVAIVESVSWDSSKPLHGTSRETVVID